MSHCDDPVTCIAGMFLFRTRKKYPPFAPRKGISHRCNSNIFYTAQCACVRELRKISNVVSTVGWTSLGLYILERKVTVREWEVAIAQRCTWGQCVVEVRKAQCVFCTIAVTSILNEFSRVLGISKPLLITPSMTGFSDRQIYGTFTLLWEKSDRYLTCIVL